MKKRATKKNAHAKRRDCARAAAPARQTGPIWPRHGWGLVLGEVPGLPGHLTAEYIKVPEGLGVRTLCRTCGGRYETLIDLREVPDGLEHLGAACQKASSRIMAHLQRNWIPGHQACSETPRRHHLPVLLQAFLTELEQSARATIRAGDSVPGMIHVLNRAGGAFGISIDDVPAWDPDDPERVNELAARHAVMRERAGAQKLDILAAVTVGEAWSTPAETPPTGRQEGSPDSSQAAKEGLILAFATSTFGQFAIADIHRAGGIVGEGHGTVDPLVWSRLGPCPLLDTLMATTNSLPQHPANRAWGAKIRVRS